MNLADDKQVRAAIENLGQTIDARVRLEQRLDQLTNLWNDRALAEAVGAMLADNAKKFWIAFVEVDKFKSINDRFGYENADALLVKVAALLGEMTACFPKGADAFRAHGDEFYLLGEVAGNSYHPVETIHRVLDQVREGVANLRVLIPDGREMSCKVSIGWACNADIPDPITHRGILVCLERAVSEANFRGRNCVVRYDALCISDDMDSPRGDCSACRCKFSFDVKRTANRTDQPFFCPNCGERVERQRESVPSPSGSTTPVGVVRLPEEA